MRRDLAVLLLPLSLLAHAGSTLRLGSEVPMVGDSAMRVIQLLGNADFKEPLGNEISTYQGERWQYQRDGGHILTVTILNGKVSDIDDRTR
jgi:hypothetical protein